MPCFGSVRQDESFVRGSSILRLPKVLLALLMGLILLEATLRALGFLWLQLPKNTATGERILVVGDSHVRSSRAAEADSFPGELSALLQKRFSGSALSVVNAGETDLNSSEALERLPGLFRKHRPGALVLMIGEANSWNRHYLHGFLEGGPSLAGFFSQLKIAGLLSRFGLAGGEKLRRPGYSVFFPDTLLAEYPTLAQRWVGYLSAYGEYGRLGESEADEAEAAVARWLADPRSGASETATRILAGLKRSRGESAEARAVVELYLSRGGKPELLAETQAPAPFGPFGRRLPGARRVEDEEDFLRSLQKNPFYAGGEPPAYLPHSSFSREEWSSLLSASLPPRADGAPGPLPGRLFLRDSLAGSDEILAWVYRDLTALVRLARKSGVPVLLQTYPPERFSGRERPVNAVIRAVAQAQDVPLSDIASELRKSWNGRALEQYYGTPGLRQGPDFLNREGNGLVAGFLMENLLRYRFVQP